MLFNSLEFLLFFPITTILYFLLPFRFRWFHLLLASCVFYGAFVPSYLLILFFTIIVDYFAGIFIEKRQGKKRKLFLVLSIVVNIGILAVFKYYNFFIENINLLFDLNSSNGFSSLSILLPIGLSFHTFQAMSYTVEVYRGNQTAEKHFGIYALYVMFYPQMVAGPIERPQNILHQFKENHVFNWNNLYIGLRLMLWGFFKKVVIADRATIYVDQIYSNYDDYGMLNILISIFLFSIQIYCDFSGYSDIARGAAKTMGYDLMLNFNLPYFSKSIKEFWSKWHISLSSWFKDYLYFPLGGNRTKKYRYYFNILVVFLVSGFWHGASWTFIIWGGIHGCLLIIESFFDKFHFSIWFFKPVKILFTFSLVSIAWIFFRATSFENAINILYDGLLLNHNAFVPIVVSDFGWAFSLDTLRFLIAVILFMFFIEYKKYFSLEYIGRNSIYEVVLNSFVLFLLVFFGIFNSASFIYFQF